MPLKSGNYGSIKRGRNSEPLKSHTDAEESGKYSPLSPGSGGACKDCSPLVPHVIETGDSGQRRGAVSASLVLLFCFLGGGLGLAFSVHKGTNYSDFSTASEDSPLSYEFLDDQTNAMMNSYLIEHCSSILNGIGDVKPTVKSENVYECLKNIDSDDAISCFENTLDDKWSSYLHACSICEGCISGDSPSQDECELIKAAMTMPLEMAWYPATGSPPSLNSWQYNGEYFHGNWEEGGNKRFRGGWMSMELVNDGWRENKNQNSTSESQRTSPLVKNNPLDAYGCLLTHCSDFALKFEEAFPEVAQKSWTCLSSRTRDTDASSCLIHPASVDVAECGSCKGCFSVGNMELSDDIVGLNTPVCSSLANFVPQGSTSL